MTRKNAMGVARQSCPPGDSSGPPHLHLERKDPTTHSLTYGSEEWGPSEFSCKSKYNHNIYRSMLFYPSLRKYKTSEFFFLLVSRLFRLFHSGWKFPVVTFSNWHEEHFVLQSKYNYRFVFPKWIQVLLFLHNALTYSTNQISSRGKTCIQI